MAQQAIVTGKNQTSPKVEQLANGHVIGTTSPPSNVRLITLPARRLVQTANQLRERDLFGCDAAVICRDKPDATSG